MEYLKIAQVTGPLHCTYLMMYLQQAVAVAIQRLNLTFHGHASWVASKPARTHGHGCAGLEIVEALLSTSITSSQQPTAGMLTTMPSTLCAHVCV